MKDLIDANCHFLSQARQLLLEIRECDFACPAPTFYNSTIGGHLRHCLEHYQSFLDGLAQGKIDYDCRQRDFTLENKKEVALQKIEEVQKALCDLKSKKSPKECPIGLLIKMDCGDASFDPWQPSTLGRELQFLVSHTVHHFAMIGGICKGAQIELPQHFGVAPSTLKHRAEA